MVTDEVEKEHVEVKILVIFPHISPSISPAKPRPSTLVSPVNLYMSSTRSQGGSKEITSKDVDVDQDKVI